MRGAVALFVAAAVGLPAQDVPRWLVDRSVVDARSGKVMAEVPEHSIVDLARSQVLTRQETVHVLRDFRGREIWRIDDLVTPEFARKPPHLGAERVVFAPIAGGLAVFDRADGRAVWAESGCPSDLVAVHGDLVIVADDRRRGDTAPAIAAFSVANGSRAFRTGLPGIARSIVAADHGIGVLGRDFVVVHDRFGPELFRLDVNVGQMVAVQQGWVILSKGRLRALDREGAELWSVPTPGGYPHSFRVIPSENGALLVVRYGNMSDSGCTITCRDQVDGGVRWTHQEPGLGVAHSKYHHRVSVQNVPDGVFVLSSGSAGAFVLELDPGDGSRRARHDVDR